jgi:hypothetical protein
MSHILFSVLHQHGEQSSLCFLVLYLKDGKGPFFLCVKCRRVKPGSKKKKILENEGILVFIKK